MCLPAELIVSRAPEGFDTWYFKFALCWLQLIGHPRQSKEEKISMSETFAQMLNHCWPHKPLLQQLAFIVRSTCLTSPVSWT